ncbi:ATP-binding protein [Brockia lithotrophica]|uniref:Replicative DNA helicase loader DnaI n=1 Tax=Brockia lithotrophica TaxID=933949 RepID=A0A660KW16_9BACL|nr:ATP-binding protein [Brockia lithotrophica]RKQ84625.1 replicative DNA helicase loader DnaI [Brockia lithotrophica]
MGLTPLSQILSRYPEFARRLGSAVERDRELLRHPKVQEWMARLSLEEAEVLAASTEWWTWLEEEDACAACPGLERCPHRLKGYRAIPTREEGRFFFRYEPCAEWHKATDAKRRRRLFRLIGVPEEFRDVRFSDAEEDDGNREALRAVRKFVEDFPRTRGLYLYGTFGVGKSFLAACAANELVERGHSVYFVYVPSLVLELRASLDGGEFLPKLAELVQADLLILDDIGAENATAWVRDEILMPLLQGRTQAGRPILFTSNLSLQDLLENYLLGASDIEAGKVYRLVERIRSYADVYHVKGRNRRMRK